VSQSTRGHLALPVLRRVVPSHLPVVLPVPPVLPVLVPRPPLPVLHPPLVVSRLPLAVLPLRQVILDPKVS
jgi:hypothetical protein